MSTAAVYQFPCRLNEEQVAAIPAELRARPQWVRYRLTDADGRGKRSKKPWHPTEDRPASSTDPATWGSFGDALEHAGRHGTHGLGFVFSADDPFVGIDLDACFDPRSYRLTPDASALVEAFQTYTEVSPSGTGVHLIGRAALPGSGKKNERVEVYDRGRFFCVTGACMNDPPAPVRDVQPEIDALLAREFGPGGEAPRETAQAPAGGDWWPSEGQKRHDWLRGKAVKLASAGFPVEGIVPALRAWAATLPGEPKTDAELRNLATSASEKYGRPPAPDPETVEPLPYFTAATVQHRERTAPELLLPGVRLHGRTLVVAPSETGKTWFSLELGTKAAVGGLVCGEWPVARPVRVLGIFAEDEPDDLEDRAAMLFEGGEFDRERLAQNLRVVADPAFWFGDATARARLFRLVADFRPELILADTVQATSDIKSFKDAEDVTRFYREHMAPLRAAAGGPCGLVLNHHTNKLAYAFDQQTDESGLIHGSDAFRRISDAVVFLRPAGDVPHLPAGGSAFVISTNKQRVGRRRGSGKHLVYLWPDQTAVAMNRPDHETPVSLVYQRELSGDEAARLTRRKRPADGLLETLGASEVPLTKADLAQRLGKKERTVDGYIAEHRDALELFVREPDGTFRPATAADRAGKSTRPLAYKVAK